MTIQLLTFTILFTTLLLILQHLKKEVKGVGTLEDFIERNEALDEGGTRHGAAEVRAARRRERTSMVEGGR